MDNTLITQDRLNEIERLARQAPKCGIIGEVGVYKGGSLKLLSDVFKEDKRSIFGFDTFEGLPKEQWNQQEIHKPGDFNDTSLEAVESFINDENVCLIKGMFPDSINSNTILEGWAFVHIDTDFYESVKTCIEWFYPRLIEGGIMVFDDYEWPNCPGVKRALDESSLSYYPTNAKYQAYLIKPKIEK